MTNDTSHHPPKCSDGKVAEDDRFPFQRLDVYRAARELAALVHRLGIRDAELRDQATRAASSVFLNLCEGLPDDRGPMRRKYFAQADGSLHETVGPSISPLPSAPPRRTGPTRCSPWRAASAR